MLAGWRGAPGKRLGWAGRAWHGPSTAEGRQQAGRTRVALSPAPLRCAALRSGSPSRMRPALGAAPGSIPTALSRMCVAQRQTAGLEPVPPPSWTRTRRHPPPHLPLHNVA
eukprot:scaffold1161_cov391-Prasinococcus_capsulatus_cf.AAC.10